MSPAGARDNADAPRQAAVDGGTIESAGSFVFVRPGDTVHREFLGRVTALRVTRIDDELIHTEDEGTYDRRTGFETDDELGLGWRYGVTISRLIRPADASGAAT